MIKHYFTQNLANEAATLAIGQLFSRQLPTGVTVFLNGDLGAGKTTFVRGVLQGMGYAGKVKSPTYTIVEPYDFLNKIVYHFDLYRFNDEEEWEMAGFRECFNPNSICLIEWPEKAIHLLPNPTIEVFLKHQTSGRVIEFHSSQLAVNSWFKQHE